MEHVNLTKISTDNNLSAMCIKNMPKKMSNEISEKIKLEKIATKLNNEILLTETTTAILTSNIVMGIKNIIECGIEYFNSTLQIERKLKNDDIKIILNSGLTIRLIIKNIFSFFKEKSNDHELLNTLENIDKKIENHKNVFKNTSEKSDIDFNVIINSDILTKEQYELISDKLIVMIYTFLLSVKKNIDSNKFYGMSYNYNNIQSDKTNGYIFKPLHRKPYIVVPIEDVKNKNEDNYNTDIHIVHSKKIFNENNDRLNITNHLVTYSRKFVKYTNINYGDIQTTQFKIKLLKLENNYDVKIPDVDKKLNISGEIINITILDYDYDRFNKKSKYHNDILTYSYVNNMTKFNFESYGLNYSIEKLERTLFFESFYPWIDTEYQIKLIKYMTLIIIKELLNENNIQNYQSDFVDDINIINELNLLDIQNLNNTLKNTSLFYNLINYSILIKKKIKMILENTSKYEDMLVTYNYDKNIQTLNEYNYKLEEYILYTKNLSDILNEFKKTYLLLKRHINIDVYEKINNFFSEEIKTIQWSGYEDLHKSYKSYYMNGGKPIFNNKNGVFNIKSDNNRSFFNDSHSYSQAQKKYISYFFDNIIYDIYYKTSKFTTNDVNKSIVTKCGSSGCSLLINHSATKKKFIIKIIGGVNDAVNIMNNDKYASKSYLYLKETMIGYYATQMQYSIFNKTYAYFKCSTNPDDIYFSSIDDDLQYVPKQNEKLNNMTYVNDNNHPTIQNGNIFMIIVDAGSGDMYDFMKIVKLNELSPSVNNENLKRMYNKIFDVFQQMFKISESMYDSKISKNITYLTHNDIKPQNMIFLVNKGTKSNKHSYDIKFIDFGGCILVKSFFTNINVHTRYYYDFINGENYTPFYVTSPLYDIGSIIVSIVEILFEDKLNNDIKKLMKMYDTRNAYKINYVDNINNELIILGNKIDVELDTITHPNHISDVYIKKKYINKILVYINLLCSINKYMNTETINIVLTNDEPNDFKNVDFANFEFPIIVMDVKYIKVLKFIQYTNLKNIELLNLIMNITKTQIEMC